MSWEVWDRETRNLIDSFDSRDEALTVLRDGVRRHGSSFVSTFQLVHEDQDGHVDWRAEGEQLSKLVIAGAPTADAETMAPADAQQRAQPFGSVGPGSTQRPGNK